MECYVTRYHKVVRSDFRHFDWLNFDQNIHTSRWLAGVSSRFKISRTLADILKKLKNFKSVQIFIYSVSANFLLSFAALDVKVLSQGPLERFLFPRWPILAALLLVNSLYCPEQTVLELLTPRTDFEKLMATNSRISNIMEMATRNKKNWNKTKSAI